MKICECFVVVRASGRKYRSRHLNFSLPYRDKSCYELPEPVEFILCQVIVSCGASAEKVAQSFVVVYACLRQNYVRASCWYESGYDFAELCEFVIREVIVSVIVPAKKAIKHFMRYLGRL